MLEHLWLSWLTQAPMVTYFFIRYCQNRRKKISNIDYTSVRSLAPYIDNSSETKNTSKPYLIVQITSRDAPSIVQEVIDVFNKTAEEINLDKTRYRIDLVVDENDKNYDFKGVDNFVVVPKDYKTPKDSKYKPRALHYAMERRRAYNENTKDYWLYLLDEESFVKKQTLLSIIKYISNPEAPPLAQGPSVFPNKFFESNRICRTVSAAMPYYCYNCVSEVDGKRLPTYIHGSNELIRSDVADAIGWDYRTPGSEDQRFGWEVWRKYGPKAFGWHGGIIEEQPPLTIKSLIKQRQRWVIGHIYNLSTAEIPKKEKLRIGGRLFSWCMGFVAGTVSLAAVIMPLAGVHQSLPDYLRIPMATIPILWLFSYQLGLRETLKNYKLSKLKRIYYHLETLLLTPISGLVETFGTFSAPFVYLTGKYKWEPTEKVRRVKV